jgi:hypothetical protein
MLSISRFRALAGAYGADLRRWPHEARSAAQALVEASAEARAILAAERKLDEAIAAASADEEAALWRPGEQDAALGRLRMKVGARIAYSSAQQPAHRRLERALAAIVQWPSPFNLYWARLAAVSVIVIVAGLSVGVMSAPAQTSGGVLALLQPDLVNILVN